MSTRARIGTIRFARLAFVAGTLFGVAPVALQAQPAAENTTAAAASPVPAVETGRPAMEPSAAKAVDQAQMPVAKPAPPSGVIGRWFDLQTGSVSTRYRAIESSSDVLTSNQMQHNSAFKGRVKLDAKGRYSVVAAAGTGNGFTSSWNNAGPGTGDFAGSFYLKQLYVSASPIAKVEVSAGGIAPIRGESTEITSYDNDSYIVGERVTAKRPEDLYFNEVSVTMAYLGDVKTSNVMSRYDRMDTWNYYQALVGKRFSKSVAVSADYTRLDGVSTLRSAATFNVAAARAVHLVRWEQYQRLGDDSAYGFGVYGERAITKRASVGAGFANIDQRYGGLNGDRFNKGKRVYTSGSIKVAPDLSVGYFLQRAVDNDFAVANKTRFDLALTYNVRPWIQRALLR